MATTTPLDPDTDTNTNTDPNPPSLPTLRFYGTTPFYTAATGGHLAVNPAADLTVTAGHADTALYLWRSGDKMVLNKYTEKGPIAVRAVRWRADGEFLAVAWSDGVVRVHGLEGSKAVQHVRICDAADAKIGFVAWVRNGTAEGRGRKKLAGREGREERMMLLDGERKGDLAVDLPRELTFLEVETALPKLPPLPVTGGLGDDSYMFSSRSTLDLVFRERRAEDADDVHIMVVGTADGGIHFSLHDAFVIGGLKHSPRGDGVFELCGHGSHPDSPTHVLLLRPQAGDGTALSLIPTNLAFLDHSPVNQSLLASKTTTLQNMVRYLKLAQSHIVSEWQSTRELPKRFMASVDEDLKKMPSGDMTITQALYHTVVTGHVFPAVQEWLVDTVAERGHKRWEKAVVAGLTSLRGLVHECFIPALERCGVILSRLLGIARFHGPGENIGFEEAQITKLLDIVSCLMMVAHKVLAAAMDELEHFNAFSTWLRFEIDKQGSSSISEELSEKEATMDNPKVLSYIQHYLASSPLSLYFDQAAKEDYVKDQQMIEPGASLMDLLDKQLQEQEAGRPYMKVLPRVNFLLNYMSSKANTVFKGIAEAEKQRVKFGQAAELTVRKKIWKHDLWMSRPSKRDNSAVASTAIVAEDDKSKIYLFRSLVPLDDGARGPPPTTACGLGLPEGVTIADFKFLDDSSLLLLCSQREEPRSVLLRIAYQSTHIPYQEYVEGQIPSVMGLDGTGTEGVSACFAFCHMAGFTPVQMEVQRASKLREDIGARACILGRDRRAYKTFDLPEDWDEGNLQA